MQAIGARASKRPAMKLSPARFTQVLVAFKAMQLLEAPHLDDIMSIFAREFPFKEALMTAEAVWVLVRVPSLEDLPHERIHALGTEPQDETDRYVRFPFSGGLELIFSEAPTAEEERQPGAARVRSPKLDSVGFVFHQPATALDSVTTEATRAGWGHRAGPAERVWAFPPSDQGRPVGFGSQSPREGELRPLAAGAGPASTEQHGATPPTAGHQAATTAPSGPPSATPPPSGQQGGTPGTAYASLSPSTSEQDLVAAFVAAATMGDGALSGRDKAMVALAAAIALRHPALTEAWSQCCTGHGVTPDQQREVAQVVAAMAAAAVMPSEP
jgi:hypothetical protein